MAKKVKLKKLDNIRSKVDTSKIIRQAEGYIKKYRIVQYTLIGFALFILAAVFTAQIKTVNTTNEIVNGKREADLIDEITKLRVQYNQLKEENEKNKEIVTEYKSSASNNNTLIASMQEELNVASTLSGLKTVKGEGVIVTMDDGDKTLTSDANVETILVHDSDVLAVVNELKAAGAEAISINGQRVIASTSIRCVGPVIQVNGVKVAAPFYIKAIGNSKYLESALNIKGGVIDTYEAYGIKIDLKTENKITIDKFDGALKFEVAEVDE